MWEEGGVREGQKTGEIRRHLVTPNQQYHSQRIHVADSSSGHDGVCYSFLELPEEGGIEYINISNSNMFWFGGNI